MNVTAPPQPQSLVYRTAYGPDGGWPDESTPQWQVRFDDTSVFATFDRVRHYPFELADVLGPAAAGRVATMWVPPRTSVALATPLQSSDPIGYMAYRCGPRPETTPLALPGFRVSVDRPERTVAVWEPAFACPDRDIGARTTARLVAPVYGAGRVVLAGPAVGASYGAVAADGADNLALAALLACLTVILGAFFTAGARLRD